MIAQRVGEVNEGQDKELPWRHTRISEGSCGGASSGWTPPCGARSLSRRTEAPPRSLRRTERRSLHARIDSARVHPLEWSSRPPPSLRGPAASQLGRLAPCYQW
eukprot:1646844-Pyramimonas_sp.AAC.1